MHLLAGIIVFVFLAIGAAKDGDYSGTIFIGKVLLGIGIFLFMACILTGFSTDGAGSVFLFSIIISVIGFFMAIKEE